MKNLISRNYYLDQLIRSMWNGDIKVITGLRRSGKSVLLFDLFVPYLLNQGVDKSQIIEIKLDQRKYFKFRNPLTLSDYIEEILNKNKTKDFYLCIDEVQLTNTVTIDGIKITIYDMLNELKDYKNLDVFVTGSNSRGLSSDIATEFRGRAKQIHVFPLSFKESFDYLGGDSNQILNQYMLYGGMPRLMFLSDERDKKEYLQNLYQEVYLKDIYERNRIKNPNVLNSILDYLASQISSLTNPNNIANALTSLTHEKINSVLVSNYINNISDSFLIQTAKRFDVKGKSYFKYPNKYYYTDIGLRNARLNYRQYDPGHIMENIIFNDLIRRGYSVDIGVVTDRTSNKYRQKEIDFVANNADQKTYIQSALNLNNLEKESAELSSLLLTKDFFKKVIIRNDISHSFYDQNGILHTNLTDFLLEKIDIF